MFLGITPVVVLAGDGKGGEEDTVIPKTHAKDKRLPPRAVIHKPRPNIERPRPYRIFL